MGNVKKKMTKDEKKDNKYPKLPLNGEYWNGTFRYLNPFIGRVHICKECGKEAEFIQKEDHPTLSFVIERTRFFCACGNTWIYDKVTD